MSYEMMEIALMDRDFTEEEAEELVKTNKDKIDFALIAGANFESIVSTLVVQYNDDKK